MATISPTRVTLDPQPASAVAATVQAKVAAAVVLAGVVLMAAGAIVLETSGADLFAVMESSDTQAVAANLSHVADHQTPLVVNLSLWILGVPTLAAGGVLLARIGRQQVVGDIARFAFAAGAAAAIVSYSMMMGIVLGLAPAHAAGEDVLAITRAIGWGASTADWVNTVMVLGVGGIAAVWAGRGSWAPRWLVGFSFVTLAASVVAIGGLTADARDVTFVIVPVGLVFMASAAVAAWRSAGRDAEPIPVR